MIRGPLAGGVATGDVTAGCGLVQASMQRSIGATTKERIHWGATLSRRSRTKTRQSSVPSSALRAPSPRGRRLSRLRSSPACADAIRSSLLMFHLERLLLLAIARDEIVLLRVIAKRAERHPQQLRRLR